jgi:4-amino-4-deoxy-L-arabinose transferase-like glycosyltransferase
VGIFALGVVLRVTVMALYSTVVLIYYGGDSTRYARLSFTGYRDLFSDPNSPAGYPAFLNIAQWLDKNIAFTIGIQHIIGLATAALLLLMVRKVGASLWIGLIPAAIVLLSGDFLFLETALLTETLWTFLIAAALWATVSARGSHPPTKWLVLAGTLFALASLVRSIALPLVVPAAAWLMWEVGGRWRRRLALGAALLVPLVVLVAGYTLIASEEGGYAGLTEMKGFNLYARVGQFADCRKFTPPKGTASLCENTPPDTRSGPFYYSYGVNAPMYRAGLQANPTGSRLLGNFAKAAIEHQPLEYLRTVGKELLRYVVTDEIVIRPDSGVGPARMSFGSNIPVNQSQTPPLLAQELSAKYSGVSGAPPGQGVRELLGSYQEIFRLSGLPTLVLLALSVVGMFVSRGRALRTILLFFSIAAYLYVAPVALSSYDVRYGVPAGMVLGVAGSLGGWSLRTRVCDHGAAEAASARRKAQAT